MNKIIENLYQSDAAGAIAAAKAKTVDWIVYLGQELPGALSHQGNVPVIHVPMADGADSKDKWEIAGVIISYTHLGDQNGERARTLVACRAGISRSPLMIVYYLCMYPSVMHPYWRKRDFEKVIKFVIDKIPQFQPEPSLYMQVEEMIR